MFHEVLSKEPAGTSAEYFAVSREAFGCYLDVISATGFRGCSLKEARSAATGRRVAITFDDGTIGHYEHALPELVARGMTATFFVTTTWIGRPGYATWDQLDTLRQAGMEIGSHTRTHRFLSELDADDVQRELRGAKEEIDAALGQRTEAIALPGGDAPQRPLRRLFAEAGYAAVATSRWGRNADPPLESLAWIRRCTVRAAPPGEFRRILQRDRVLSARRQVRESVLGALRRALGPSRYARWRRQFIEAAGRSST